MNGERCRKCGQLPEDILMLTCQHDLCLKCAADRLRYDPRRKQQLPFCCMRTEIDEETHAELQKYIPLKKNVSAGLRPNSREPSRENSLSKRSEIFPQGILETRKSLANLHNLPTPVRSNPKDSFESSIVNSRRLHTNQSENSAPAAPPRHSKRQCTNHPDEQLMYYCFDCNCDCICPECVIHGEHKNHEVQTIKKSVPLVKNHLNNSTQCIQKSIDELLQRQSEIIRTIEQAKSKSDRTKLEIQKVFNDLVDSIHQKEKQVMRKYDQALDSIVNGYRLTQETLLEKIKERKASVSLISSTLLKDDVTLTVIQITVLNNFASNISTFERLGRLQASDEGQFKPTKNLPTSEWIIRQIQQMSQRLNKLEMEQSRQSVLPSISAFSYRSSLTPDLQPQSRSQLFRYLPATDTDRQPPDNAVACE